MTLNYEIKITLDTEIRHLRSSDQRWLANVLDVGDRWKDFASVIPNSDGKEGFLLTSSNINLLEQQKYILNGSPTRALLDYWSTSGRKRPLVKNLLHCLIQSKSFIAADYVAVNILKGSPVSFQFLSSNKNDQSSIPLTRNQALTSFQTDQMLQNEKKIEDKPTAPNLSALSLEDNNLYEEMIKIFANNKAIKIFNYFQLFGKKKSNLEPVKLGEGAFGTVYKAFDSNLERVAVKVLKEEFGKHFYNELNALTQYKHENLLTLLGIAYHGLNLCLVYEYMENGSVYDRLACINNTPPLSWSLRIKIAVETAKGIGHLHKNLMVHRDIKSANILLDSNFSPKVGDFGLIRIASQGLISDNMTTNVVGTSLYMAPEAFRGEISFKMDTFSFGIVLIELLTGQLPFDENREGADILSWSQEEIADDIKEECLYYYLDKKAGNWDLKIAHKLFKISRKATEEKKKDRPTILELFPLLEDLI